jgi:hypothetical protein
MREPVASYREWHVTGKTSNCLRVAITSLAVMRHRMFPRLVSTTCRAGGGMTLWGDYVGSRMFEDVGYNWLVREEMLQSAC